LTFFFSQEKKQKTFMSKGTRMQELPTWRRLLIFGLLLCSEFLYGWAWNSVDVLRPFLRESLHLSLLQAGSLYSAQGAGALVGAVVMGQLADRLGLRRVLTAIILGYGTMLLAGIIVASYPELLGQRFMLGFFAGGVFPVGVGVYVNLFHARLRGRLAGTLNAFFNGSVVMLGLALSLTVKHDWRLLLWMGGLPPFILAPIMFMALPGTIGEGGPAHVHRKLPIAELFHPSLRKQTILLALMTGLNFFGYQAYSGWLTTYLTSTRGLTASVAGGLVAWQFAGNVCGGFFWGWAADRFGRRFNAIGFLIAAVSIAIFLASPTNLPLLRGIGFIYGGTLCASVVWGPWLAELYPPHLKSTAASIFNWGRIISFFAPLITAGIANRFGMAAAMLSASLSFSVAACIWLMQRETLSTQKT
jgi:MFS family permease